MCLSLPNQAFRIGPGSLTNRSKSIFLGVYVDQRICKTFTLPINNQRTWIK